MYFLLYGDDSYRSRTTLSRMEAKFRADRDASGLNVTRLRAKEASVGDVAEALFASPFLAEKKLVILEGFLGLPAAEQKRIAELLERAPDSTTVIFYEDAGADAFKRSALFALLKPQKFTGDHPLLAGAQLSKYLRDAFTAQDVTIGAGALTAFTAAVGDRPWLRESEIAKLASYVRADGRTEVAESDVRSMVEAAHEDSLFAFMDACMEGRQRDALTLLSSLYATGMSELQVVAMLTKQFRNLVAVRDCVDRGITDRNEVAALVGMHPFPAGKALQLCRRFSPALLDRSHDRLLEMDRQLKSGEGRGDVLLQVFVTKLTAVGRS